MRKISRRKLLFGFAAGAAGVGLFQYGAADKLTVERNDLTLPRWDADGFRLALLADLHADDPRRTERALAAVRLAMEETPDLILIAGDFVSSSSPDVIHSLETILKQLGGAKCPVVAVMGNHDYWGHQPYKVIRAIESSTVNLLRNETFETQGVTVAGIDDALMGLHKVGFFPKDSSSKSLIAMLHEPDFVSEIPLHASLMLSGHSHGGQICLPFGVSLHTPRGARKYISGYYPDAPVPLYVSRGVGTTGPDIRLFCRPEISILTLRGA